MASQKIKCPNCNAIMTIEGNPGDQISLTCSQCKRKGIVTLPKKPLLHSSDAGVPAITVQNLTKSYEKVRAVDTVNFSVKKGEIFGFLGPNGAGKTTTIKSILGLINPDNGMIELDGKNINSKGFHAHKDVGYLPEKAEFYDNLTALQNLEFYADLKKIPRNVCPKLLQEFNIADAANKKVKAFSKGMKQRLGLARAVLGHPSIIILDEPSGGLDPRGVKLVRDHILSLKEHGSTVLVSSHILSEIQEVSDRVGIINRGKIVAVDKIENLSHTLDLKPKLIIELDKLTPEIKEAVKTISAADRISARGNTLEIVCPANVKVTIINTIAEAGGNIVNIRTEEPDLEDVFMRYTEE